MLSNALQRRAARRASTVVLAVGALLAGGAVSASAATITGSASAPVYNGEALATVQNTVTVTQVAPDVTEFTTTATDLFSADPADPNCVRAGTNLLVTCTVPPAGAVTSVTVNGSAADEIVQMIDVVVAITENGSDGNDTLSGSNLANTTTLLNGGAGDDQMSGTISDATLNGGDGKDSLFGGAGNDTINGDAGDEVAISGGDGNDVLNGGDGNDTFANDAGSDDIHGGAGIDQMIYTGPGPGPSDVVASLDDVANDGIAGENDNVHSDVEAVLGDAANGGNDTMHGGGGADFFEGFAGDDSIDLIDGAADLGVRCDEGGDVVYADAADLVDPNNGVPVPGFDPGHTCEAVADKDAMSFGSLTAGQSSGAQTVTILNHSAAAIALGTVASNGQFNKTADTCSNAPLAAGASCSVSMTFAPSSAGALAGTLSIPTAGRAVSIALSGTGVAAPVVTPAGGGAIATPPPPPPPPAVISKPAAAKSVSVKIKPSRDRSKPYSFTFSGKVTLPAGVTKAKGCSGTVTITLKNGKKTVTTKKAGVKKDCTFSAKVKVSKKGKMKASVKFGGNSAVGAKSAASHVLRAG